MDYISAKEASKKWGISQRRVAVLCSEGRIEKAPMVGKMWLIPKTAKKPEDGRISRYEEKPCKKTKPFLKWAGGKGQLLTEIQKHYPFSEKINKYAEPFVGGGAVLFDVLDKFDLKEVYISDINADLINTYRCVKDNPEQLITSLKIIENEYLIKSNEQRKKYYLDKRNEFNQMQIYSNYNNLDKATLLIFLNKTCFNGLYRVNRKGAFNVPMGSYKKPIICDENNLRTVSEKLKNVNIVRGDYRASYDFIDRNTFVYFDPPYRPLSNTSNFKSYTNSVFGDKEQIELAEYTKLLNDKGAKIVASNSDPKNNNEHDNFFEDLYSHMKIARVNAKRTINSKANGRGIITELLFTNC